MYRVVVALVILLLVLLYQSRTREAFATDASGNTASTNITLSIADLITLFNLTKPTVTDTTKTSDSTKTEDTTSKDTTTTATLDAAELYKQIRPSLLSDLSNVVSEKIAGAPYTPPAPISNQGSCDSDSMAQGVEFSDAKVSLEDNSDYIRKDSIPCYNCSL